MKSKLFGGKKIEHFCNLFNHLLILFVAFVLKELSPDRCDWKMWKLNSKRANFTRVIWKLILRQLFRMFSFFLQMIFYKFWIQIQCWRKCYILWILPNSAFDFCLSILLSVPNSLFDFWKNTQVIEGILICYKV